MRGEFRKVRATMAETMRRHAAELPAAVSFEVRDEDTESVPPEGSKTEVQ